MTTETQFLQLHPTTDNSSDQASALQLVAQTPDPASDPPKYTHRGNGKVALLPRSVRDQVNIMMADGIAYPEIIRRLGDYGKDLNPGHLCEHRKRGHQDWLRQQQWLDHLFSKTDFSSDVMASPQSSDLHEAGLRFAAAQMLEQLGRFAEDPSPQSEKFARLVNALSRLTREALAFRKYHDSAASQRAVDLKQLPADRPLTDGDHDTFVSQAEQFFGRKIRPIIIPWLYDPPEPDSP